MPYEEKLAIADKWLMENYGVGWDDLPDINSLHDCDSVEEIIEACQERVNEI